MTITKTQTELLKQAIKALNSNKRSYVARKFFEKVVDSIDCQVLIDKVKTQSRAIFQGQGNDNDGKRLQREVELSDIRDAPEIGGMHELLYDLMKSIDRKLSLSTASLLLSLVGCMQQRLHYDYDSNVETSSKSYIIIVALMDGTKLVRADGDRVTVMYLNKGDLLIARGDFVHAGAAYSIENIRLHWYVDYKGNGRKNGTTYAVSNLNDISSTEAVDYYYNYSEVRRQNSAIARSAKRKLKLANFNRTETLRNLRAKNDVSIV